MHKKTVSLVLALALASCASLEPTYSRPAAPVSAVLPVGAATADATLASDIPWSDFVKDAKLKQVIAIALANSRDLRKTVANIESARAQYGAQRAAQLPHLDANASGTRARSLTTGTNGADVAYNSQSYSVGGSLSAFELDLFGKQRSLSKAAYETYLSTAEAGRATRVSLIAETATAYITLASDTSQRALAQRTLESAQRSMDMTTRRLGSGVASRVDVKQAETVYQQARADLAGLTTTIAQDRNALDLLAGTHIDDALLPEELPVANTWFAEVPVGLASDVLLARPDVLAAEHTLKAANANIGAARAAFFPSLSLTGSGGAASSELSTLFSAATGVWSVTPSLVMPIFDGGANNANLSYAKAQRELSVSTYELTIQTAFKEVADALAVRSNIQQQLDAQTALVDAAAESYRLADARYSKGVDTFLSALDSQRTLYSAEKALVSTRLAAFDNAVSLYRVLGGGVGPGETAVR